MPNTPSDLQVTQFLQAAADDAPLPGDLAATTVRLGRGRQLRRRVVMASGGVAVCAAAALVAVLVVTLPEPPSAIPVASGPVTALSCGGSVTVGQYTHIDGSDPSTEPPLEQAVRWLKAMGMADRYPGWSVRADEGPGAGEVTVTVVDAIGQSRASLDYRRRGDGWDLVRDQRC